jgi:hypothetical protein
MYIVNHWNDAAAYSGEQIGDRLKDSSALHFHRDGSANVELYSEETALAKKKTSIPLRDRILPQYRRIQTLTDQLIELETEYKAGKMSIQEYTQLRAVLVTKRNRATVLYQKAVSVKEPTHEDDELSFNMPQDEVVLPYASCAVDYSKPAPSHTSSQAPDTHYSANNIPAWITDLSSTNSLKKPLKIACTLVRKTVQFSQKAKSYYQELKAV